MNLIVLLLAGLAIFFLGTRFYGRFIEKSIGVDPLRPTPAITCSDGLDFVPTKLPVVFAHHFSAIAGAGPILGPTMVLLYGYAPAWWWIVLGSVFFGAVHDFTALFVCMREGGRSIAEVANHTLGRLSFAMVILFSIVMLVLVTSNFLAATAVSLTSEWPLSKLGLSPGEGWLQTVPGPNGEPMGVIGGIASTSVIIVTLLSPLLGYLIFKRGIGISLAYLLAALICIGSVTLGVWVPVRLEPHIWMTIIAVYVLFAASLPVWMILQPRDFINVQILYLGLILLGLSVVIAGVHGTTITFPAAKLTEGAARLGMIWPMLFITVACGAISGFHALVAGGTTSKQISTEGGCRRVGYDGMLLEGVLALLVVLTLAASLSYEDYQRIVWPAPDQAGLHSSNPILAFSLAAGRMMHQALSIPQALGTVFGILLVEGFVITTLDAAVRLNRYLFEELWTMLWNGSERVPGLLKNAHFNAGLAVTLMCLLAFTNSFNTLWPLFGSSNQLMAALTLIVVSAWLLQRGKNPWYTLIPAVAMLLTTLTSLGILLYSYILSANYLLVIADLMLMILGASAAVLAAVKLKGARP